MTNKLKQLGKVLTLTGAFGMLASCGGESNDAQIVVAGEKDFPSYVEKLYRSEQIDCTDLNLDGTCGDGEVISDISTTSPIIKSYEGFYLTAVGNSTIITPFTTLINNEVMYNPLVKGDITLAKNYLSSKFSLDFSALDTTDGPEASANEIIASLIKANQLSSNNPYINIAAAVDLMVYAGSFTVEPLQIHLDKQTHPQLTVEGSFSLNTTGQVNVSNFDLHPVTGRMIIIADDDTRIALNANTGAYAVVTTDSTAESIADPAPSPSKPSAVQSSYTAPLPQKDSDDDDDDHDEDDDYGDDDYDIDDWYDDYAEWLAQQNGSKYTNVAQIVQSNSTNQFFMLSTSSEQNIATTCAATGEQGIFLMAMEQGAVVTASSAPVKTSTQQVSAGANYVGIDAYSAASTPDIDIFNPPTTTPTTTDTPLPDAIPGIDSSEAACYNTSFKQMAITDDSTVIAVVADNTSGDTIHRLSGDTLTEQSSPGYQLGAGISVVDITVSNNGEYAAFTDSAGLVSLVNFNSMTLVASYNYAGYQLSQVAFISEQQLVVIGNGTTAAGTDNQVLFMSYSSNTLALSQAVTLAHDVDKLTVNKNAKLVAVANDEAISIINANETTPVIQVSYSDAGQQINQIGLLSDKVIFSANSSLYYISLEGVSGSELRAAQRYLTQSLLVKPRQTNATAALDLPTTLPGLDSVTISWSTNYPAQLDVTTGHLNYTYASDITVTASISGLFRGETHTIEKLFKL